MSSKRIFRHIENSRLIHSSFDVAVFEAKTGARDPHAIFGLRERKVLSGGKHLAHGARLRPRRPGRKDRSGDDASDPNSGLSGRDLVLVVALRFDHLSVSFFVVVLLDRERS